ncbi:MAG TPA: YdeI/OmpD-associated family protein [Candidatus Saccharimonadales bacterium]|nr:YdeI/OmpD-associated family protein [Candidatus Saccharimonadales bacterium]
MELFKDLPVLLFASQKDWNAWLENNHNRPQGVWLKHAKKSSSKKSVSYQEALEEALCYGWIDSQKQAYDHDYFLQKFTPRGPKSIWSKNNVAKVESLIKIGKMQPSGLAAVNEAKHDGRWDDAYDSPSASKVPEDFQAALDKNPKARQFFETLNKANVYAFCWRVQTAKKPETRIARIDKFIEMLNRGEKLH